MSRVGGRPRAAALAVVACAGAVSLACRHPERSPLERGTGVFLRSCAGCHGPDARGTHPPGFATPPRDLTDPALQARLTDGAIRETVHYGKGQMPPFGAALSEGDVNDLLAFIRSVNREKRPKP